MSNLNTQSQDVTFVRLILHGVISLTDLDVCWCKWDQEVAHTS